MATFSPIRRTTTLGAVCCAVGAIVATLGCDTAVPPQNPGAPPVAHVAKPLIVVASGDVGGRLEATSCKAARPGGFTRRAELLAQLRDGYEAVVVDVGGANEGDAPFDRFLWEAVLRNEVALGTVAHNLGREEAELPAEVRARLAAKTGIAWVSSNIRDAAGAYVAEPLRVIDRAGRTTVILGLLGASRTPAGVRIDPPLEAVETVLRDYDWRRRRPDALVVLLDAERSEAVALAATLPEWAIVLRRGESDAEAATVDVGLPTGEKRSAALLDVPARGEGAALAELRTIDEVALSSVPAPTEREATVWRARIQPLDEELGVNVVLPANGPSKTSGAVAFQRDVARNEFTAADGTMRRPHAFTPKPDAPSTPEPPLYAGADACRVCHRAESLTCDAGPHARAWQTLIDRGAQHDLRCQTCHTTGFGEDPARGGFVSAKQTPAAIAVRCEACHGPSAAHAAEPMLPTPWLAAQSCAQCHDREHSPGFLYDDAWLRIRHGERAAQWDDRIPTE